MAEGTCKGGGGQLSGQSLKQKQVEEQKLPHLISEEVGGSSNPEAPSEQEREAGGVER